MTQNHTPTPYAVEIMPSGRRTITSGQFFVAGNDCDYALGQEDAAFIVRACNAHDDLVAKLEKAERFIVGFEGDPAQEGIDELIAEIRGTLAKAKAVQ